MSAIQNKGTQTLKPLDAHPLGIIDVYAEIPDESAPPSSVPTPRFDPYGLIPPADFEPEKVPMPSAISEEEKPKPRPDDVLTRREQVGKWLCGID